MPTQIDIIWYKIPVNYVIFCYRETFLGITKFDSLFVCVYAYV